MSAYAVALLRKVDMGREIVEYLERIDATLEAFGGRYLVHGGEPSVLEGNWLGDLIVIAFPDRESALAWYRSPAYREIVGLRRAHSEGEVVVVEGVAANHRALDILSVR